MSIWTDSCPGSINRDNHTLHGKVPLDLDPNTYRVHLTARDGTAEDHKTFMINIVTEGNLREDGAVGSSGAHAHKAGIIMLSVFIPLGCTGIALLLLYWRRRGSDGPKMKAAQGSKALTPGPTGPELPHCQPFEKTIPGKPPAMDKISYPAQRL